MRKIYLLLVLCFLSFTNFATTWYANTGNADNMASWWSDATYTGTHPVSFSTVGDIWMMNGSMTTGGVWTLGGSLIIDTGIFTPSLNVTINGDLTMNNSAVFSVNGSYSADLVVNLYGNLNVNGAAYWQNPPATTQIHFANTASSVVSPQTISWTSTAVGNWTGINIDPNVTVQLLSNVTLPIPDDQPETLNGVLVTGNYVLNLSGNNFLMNNGATLYTQNAGGVDGAITGGGTYTFQNATNYVFNGNTTIGSQVTGLHVPSSITSGGSITVNNPAGVGLSQTESIGNGASFIFDTGNVTLGVYNLMLGVTASLAGTFSNTSMVITNGPGQLIKQFNADATFMYPVGDITPNFTPITLNVSGTSFAPGANTGVSVTNSKHPANANTNDYLNRYWSVSTSGIDSQMYSISATYVPGDVTGTEVNLSTGQYTGSLPWMKFGVTNPVTHTLTSPTVSNIASDFTGISTAGPSLSVAGGSVCIGGSDTLTVSSPMRDGPFTYTWATPTGLSATTGTSVVATPTVTTTYTVTITDANGFTGTAMATVTVNQFPTVDTVTGGGSYCAGGTGVHIGLNASDTGVNYQVYHSGFTVGSPVAGTGSVLDLGAETAAGSYTVVATGITSTCTVNMADSATVSITPVVIPSVSISSNKGDTLCAGTMTTFSASVVHGGTTPVFQWKVNGTTAGTDSANYSYIPSDLNMVVVKLTSDAICAIPDTVMDTLVMSVFPNGTPTIHITSAPGDTVCLGTGVTITSAITFGGTAPSYSWIKNTLPVSSASSYAYTPANGDYVFAILKSNYRCRLDTTPAYSNIIAMTVETPIVPSVTIAAYPGTTITVGAPDTLVATVSGGGASPSYQWYVNHAAIPLATTNTFIRSIYSDKDSVSCIVTRNDACAQSSINSVVIHVRGVGVQQVNSGNNDITLTPNPNKGTFTVKGSLGSTDDQEVTMEITNMIGQVVYSNKAMALNGQLNELVATHNTLADGIYILSLYSTNGKSTIRFVVGQ